MNKYILNKPDETIVKINNLAQQQPNENIKLLNCHLSPVGNSNSTHPDLNDKLCACCYWSLILGIGGMLISTTIWSLVKYYGYRPH